MKRLQIIYVVIFPNLLAVERKRTRQSSLPYRVLQKKGSQSGSAGKGPLSPLPQSVLTAAWDVGPSQVSPAAVRLVPSRTAPIFCKRVFRLFLLKSWEKRSIDLMMGAAERLDPSGHPVDVRSKSIDVGDKT